MKCAIVYVLLCASLISRISAASQDDIITKYYKKFNTFDGMTVALVGTEFDKEVPETQRLDVLLGILSIVPKNGEYDALPQIHALTYIIAKDSAIMWTSAKETKIYDLSTSPNPGLRICVINFLEAHKSGRDKQMIAKFLDDNEDDVRSHAMIKIGQLPNAKAIFSEFIHKNPDKANSRSYKIALKIVVQNSL